MRAELIRVRSPADQVLDEGLRHARVHVVMRHVIADAVGAPSERELRQVARADDDGSVLVRQAEQMTRALARLHVLESDVVHGLAGDEGVADVLQHLQAARADVDLGRRAAHRSHEPPRLVERPVAGGESGHRVREDIRSRQAHLIHRLRTHDKRLGRVQAARDADHDLSGARRMQPRGKSLHLDAVHLLAALVAT